MQTETGHNYLGLDPDENLPSNPPSVNYQGDQEVQFSDARNVEELMIDALRNESLRTLLVLCAGRIETTKARSYAIQQTIAGPGDIFVYRPGQSDSNNERPLGLVNHSIDGHLIRNNKGGISLSGKPSVVTSIEASKLGDSLSTSIEAAKLIESLDNEFPEIDFDVIFGDGNNDGNIRRDATFALLRKIADINIANNAEVSLQITSAIDIDTEIDLGNYLLPTMTKLGFEVGIDQGGSYIIPRELIDEVQIIRDNEKGIKDGSVGVYTGDNEFIDAIISIIKEKQISDEINMNQIIQKAEELNIDTDTSDYSKIIQTLGKSKILEITHTKGVYKINKKIIRMGRNADRDMFDDEGNLSPHLRIIEIAQELQQTGVPITRSNLIGYIKNNQIEWNNVGDIVKTFTDKLVQDPESKNSDGKRRREIIVNQENVKFARRFLGLYDQSIVDLRERITDPLKRQETLDIFADLAENPDSLPDKLKPINKMHPLRSGAIKYMVERMRRKRILHADVS